MVDAAQYRAGPFPRGEVINGRGHKRSDQCPAIDAEPHNCARTRVAAGPDDQQNGRGDRKGDADGVQNTIRDPLCAGEIWVWVRWCHGINVRRISGLVGVPLRQDAKSAGVGLALHGWLAVVNLPSAVCPNVA